jgi:hypothetical protein
LIYDIQEYIWKTQEENYKEELHNLYSVPKFSRIIRTDEISGGCSSTGKEMYTKPWSVSLNERDSLEDPDFYEVIILMRI